MFLRKIKNNNLENILIKQGDIIYVDLGTPIGSEQGGIRPCIVLQNDIGNKFSPTIIVAAITSELKNLNMPTHFIIENYDEVGLKEKSMIMFEQIRSIDKRRIKYEKPFGNLPIDEVLEPFFRSFGFTKELAV